MVSLQSIDSWPRTRRPLPWLFAGFLASVFLVPIDAVQLKVHLPFSSDYDRFFVAIICVVWAIGVVMHKRTERLRLRPKGWALPVLIFFAIAVFTIVLNIGRITNLGELDVAEKRLALLISMFAVFAVFAVSLRVTELRNFAVLIVVLATLTSLGTIYEQKTGENLFYSTASSVLGPIAEVEPGPTEAGTNPSDPGRPLISGPTRHALSVASLLGMSVPFAVMFAAMTPSRRRKLLWGLVACLIVAGALVTQRRSGLIVPLVAVVSLFAFRPRKMLPLLPWAVVACLVGLVLSGGSISAISQLTGNGDQASTEGRTSDYEAVIPDLLTHPAFGRGYGTLDSIKVDTYRIFDNEYLGEALPGGADRAARLPHADHRSGDPGAQSPALRKSLPRAARVGRCGGHHRLRRRRLPLRHPHLPAGPVPVPFPVRDVHHRGLRGTRGGDPGPPRPPASPGARPASTG